MMSANKVNGEADTAGSYIRILRERIQMSLRGFAEILGYSHNYLYDIEHGNRKPSTEFIGRLIGNIDLSPEERKYLLSLSNMSIEDKLKALGDNLSADEKELMQLLKETGIVVGAYSGKLSTQSVRTLIKHIKKWRDQVASKRD